MRAFSVLTPQETRASYWCAVRRAHFHDQDTDALAHRFGACAIGELHNDPKLFHIAS